LDEGKNTDMPLCLPSPEAIHGPTIGIYRVTGRNDEAVTSPAYATSLHTAFEQILGSAFWLTKVRFAGVRRRLDATASLAQGWDSYGSEPPNAIARGLAERILDLLEAAWLAPTQLTPTVEGGIALSFVEGESRAVIEIYNTGEIAAATYSDQGEPRAWELEPAEARLRGSIEQIRVHLAA
jgi:hypothetical protein